MQTLVRDLVHGARSWIRQPLFLLTSIAVLAIGLGANLTIFSLVDGLLLRPTTADRADRLVGIYSRDTTQPDSYRPFSYPNYQDIAAAQSVFDSVLAHSPSMVGVVEGEVTRRVFADFVSANFFTTLRTPLARGRAFTAAEEKPGADIAVAVISEALFNRLGRPDDVLGRTLRVNGRDYAIVGVTPPWFTGTTAIASPEVWLPLGVFERSVNEFRRETSRPLTDRTNHALFLIGRLKPGLSFDGANRALVDLSTRMAADQPDANAHQELSIHPAPRMSISNRPPDESGLRIAAVLLLSVATVVLVIACLNVATLLLSRGMARRREIAIRLALGAARWQIVRQLLVEGLAVATIACAIGIAAAQRMSSLLVATIQAMAPLPIVFDTRLDVRTLAAAVGWTALSTVLFALGPAWKLTRADVMDDLQRRPIFATGGSWRRRWVSGTNVLVVAQIALSMVLLTTAGLFLRGAARSIGAPLGFAIDGEVTAMIDPAFGGYDTGRGHQLNLLALERLRALPFATSAAVASTVPFGDTREGAAIAAAPTTRRDQRVQAGLTIVGRDYFRTLGIPLVAGRDFSSAEERSAPADRVAVIDQLAARRLWPGVDPIGRIVYIVRADKLEPLTIVGVVAPIRIDLMNDPEPALYIPFGQEPRTNVTLHARVPVGAETATLPSLRAALASVDAGLPVLKVATLATLRDESAEMWILNTSGRIFATLGVLAALVAILGLYAVIAYVVSRRVKEIGIRMALGAASRDVVVMVLRDGAALAAVGLAVGLLLSAAAAQVVRSVAAALAVVDPTVFAVPPLLLAFAALAALLIPATRAAGLPPVVALRDE